MAGDATNAALWQGADVFIAPVGTAGPTNTTTAWAAAWEAVGLLSGDEGFTINRDEDTAEHYAWGGILVKKVRSKHKRTIAFAALEDNDVVFDLVNPGSTRTTDATTGVTTADVKVPEYRDFALGMEMRDGDKVKRRVVGRATIEEVGEVTENETDLTVYTITVVVYPEADGTLYTEIS